MKIEINDIELRQITEQFGQKAVDKLLSAHREADRINGLNC